jgi:general secretion pathway protein L
MDFQAQSMRPQLEELRRAWRGSPLPGFFRWWGGELRACLPVRWRAWFRRGEQWRMLEAAGNDWTLRAPGTSAPLAQIDASLTPARQQAALREACVGIDPADLRLALCLPATAVLRRKLHLPAAAAVNLHQVVGYELDRQTPFTPAQVFFDTLELPTERGVSQIEAELVATPRDRLEPLLARLDEAGIGLDAVDVCTGQGERLGVNLLPPAQRRRHVNPRRRLNLALGALLVLLVLVCMGQWLHNRRAAVDAMRAQVQTMHDQASAVMKLRERLAASAGAAGFLAHQRAQSPTVLAVLSEVSKRLPGDTWLERFNIGDDGSVGMQGQSPQAARLVDLLKKSPLLSEPGFQGVIQTDPRTHKERFYLTAHLSTAKAAQDDPHDGKDKGHAAETR